jgi:PmbA protein
MSGSDGEKNTGLDYAGVVTHDLSTPLLSQGSLTQHLKDTEASLNSVPLPGKFEGTVILTPDCLGNFIYMLASNYIMGSVIMEGTSQWLNRLGEQVASGKVTLSLKAQDDRLATAQPFTGDGYRSEDVTVIDKGVLNSFLLSLYAAKKTGRPVTKNTSFALVMEPGDTSLADMIASVEKGLIVGGFSGGQPGANGEFSGVAKNSFYVENGRIVGAVTETMINGNLENVFKNVIAVSREQVCDGSTVLPWLSCGGIVISGK